MSGSIPENGSDKAKAKIEGASGPVNQLIRPLCVTATASSAASASIRCKAKLLKPSAHSAADSPATSKARAGQDVGIANFGVYAMNSLRMEKAYRGWGSELTNEVTMIEADMERFVKLDKGDFTGRKALVKRKEDGITTKLVYLAIDAADADTIGGEPVHAQGRVIGVTTSGAYGHAVKQSLAFAYVEPELSAPGTVLQVSILDEARTARVLVGPVYDPENVRLKA